MIVTFYSYKGGVGRSMAIANVAALLARTGLRVVVVDADLEAPGVGAYFANAIEDKSSGFYTLTKSSPGLVDLYHDFSQQDFERDFQLPSIEQFLLDIVPSISSPIKLRLLTAGNQVDGEGSQYFERFSAFKAIDNSAGRATAFFEWLRRELNSVADIVLVDSRTGITEMGGVATRLLADLVVAICAPNEQNLQGVVPVIKKFFNQDLLELRKKLSEGETDRETPVHRPLDVFVLPGRIDLFSPGDQYRRFAQKLEEQFEIERREYAFGQGSKDEPYLKLLTEYPLIYDPHRSFGEKLAAPLNCDLSFGLERHSVDPLLNSYHELANELVQWLLLRIKPIRIPSNNAGLPVTHLITCAPEEIASARVLQSAVESTESIGRVSLGLFDTFGHHEALSDRLSEAFATASPMVQLVNSKHDYPHNRWGMTDLAKHVWRTLGAFDFPSVRVVHGDKNRYDDSICWRGSEDLYDVARAIHDRFRGGDVRVKFGSTNPPAKLRHSEGFGTDLELRSTDEIQRIKDEIQRIKKEKLNWDNTRGSARSWWKRFEDSSKSEPEKTLWLARELETRGVTIRDLFLVHDSDHSRIEDSLIELDFKSLQMTKRESQREVLAMKKPRHAKIRQRAFSTLSIVELGGLNADEFTKSCIQYLFSAVHDELPNPVNVIPRQTQADVMLWHLLAHLGKVDGSLLDWLKEFFLGIPDLQIGPLVNLTRAYLVNQDVDGVHTMLSKAENRNKETRCNDSIGLEVGVCYCRGLAFQVLKDHESALRELEPLWNRVNGNLGAEFLLKFSLACSWKAVGKNEEARSVLETMDPEKPFLDYGEYNSACFNALNGNGTQCLEELERCLNTPSQLWPEWASLDPELANVADSPQFSEKFSKIISKMKQIRREIKKQVADTR